MQPSIIGSTIRSCVSFHRPEHLRDQPTDSVGCLRIYGAKFLLEVCGASGAVWGMSEIMWLRTTENSSTVWRPMAMTIFVAFAVRWYWHAKHYLERHQEFPPIKLHHRRLHKLPFVQIFGTKLLLEVCGAAGAIWGSSEVLFLRTLWNREEWRMTSIGVFLVFFVRWMILVFHYCLYFTSPWWEAVQNSNVLNTMIIWTELLAVKFVLEVLGAAGAVWGFAEVLTFRTDETLGVWRPIAMAVGLLFAIRWLARIGSVVCHGFRDSAKEDVSNLESNSDGIEVPDSHDLSLQETDTGDSVVGL